MKLKFNSDKILITVLALLLLAIALIITVTLYQSKKEKQLSKLINETQEAILNSEKILAAAKAIETGSRAFLLTGEQNFFQTYDSAKKDFSGLASELKTQTAGTQLPQQLIDSMVLYVKQRISFADSIILLQKDIDFSSALHLVKTGQGKIYLENIRRVSLAMQFYEINLLEERKKAIEAVTSNGQQIIIVIAWTILAAMVILFLNDRQIIRKKEQKKLSGIIKKSEERFHLLSSNFKNYTFIMLDTEGRIISWNAGAENIKGYKAAEVIGKSFEIFYTEEDIKKGETLKCLKKAREYGQYETEIKNLRKDGTAFWAQVVFTALTDDAGKLYGYSKFTRDITESKKAQEQLELLSIQINQANDAIYTTDANRKIITWNRGAENLYGFTKQEVLGKDANDILQTDITKERINLLMKEIVEIGYWTGELTRKTKDGKTLFVRSSISAIRDNFGVITGFAVVNLDITGEKKLQEQLNHLANLVEQSSEAIFSRGTDRRITSWNRGAEDLFGYTKEEAIGKTSNELQFSNFTDAEILAIEKQIVETGRWRSEKDFFHKNGSSFFGAVTGNLIKDEKGSVAYYYFIVKDISVRKKLETQLQKYNEELEEEVKIRTEEIKRSEKRYRNLFETNPLPMWVIDLNNFRFLDVNEMAVLHYGYTREEFLSMTALDIRPDQDKESFIQSDHSFGTNPGNFNKGIWRHRKKDGTIIQVEIIGQQIIFEGTPARFILANDVTERNNAERKLASSEKRFRALTENNNDIISLLDSSFKIVYRSPSAYRITGWSNEEMESAGGNDHIHPDDKEHGLSVVRELMTNPGKPINTIFRSRHKDGHYLWLEGSVTNRLAEDDINGIVLNFRDVTERKKAEEKLIASEEQFRHTLDSMLEGIQIIGFDWRYIYVNDALAKQVKYSKEEMIGFTVMEKFPGIENTEIYKVYQQCSIERAPVHLEYKFEFPDKSTAWFELSFQPVPEGIFILSVDITNRKKAESELLLNERRFRSLIENIADAIVVNDPDSNILYQSPSVTRILGYTPEERQGRKVLDYIHPDDKSNFIGLYEKIKISPNIPIPFEYRFLHKKGMYVWLEGVVTNLMEDPAVGAYVANYRDITQRKEAEEFLRKSEEHYRMLVEQSVDGIFLSDVQGKYIAVNTAGCKMLGYSRKEIMQLTNTDIIVPDEIYRVPDEMAKLEGDEIVSSEWRFKRKDGTEFIAEVIARTLPDGGIQRIVRDITERKQIENEIKELNAELEKRVISRTTQLKKANEELEAFSYSISHDLRAPLRAIIGFTAILEEDYSNQLDTEARRITGVIKSSTLRMGNLIDDLLSFSRMARHEMTKAGIDMQALVQEVINNLDNKNLNTKWIIHSLPSANADLNTIRQVWINLISNAVKYSGKRAEPIIEIGSYEEPDQIIFFVKDNGAGFDEKYKNKLFKVFQRLHSTDQFEGTGIGLAIVEKIISKHGGNVWVQATVNKGACFYFSLPIETGHTNK